MLLSRNETSADKEWINYSVKNRHIVRILTFNKLHNLVCIKSFKGTTTNIEIIPRSLDTSARTALMKVANNLSTDFPDTDLFNQLKRDYAMTLEATSLYLTGYFDTTAKSRLQIKGVEAWIVELFVEKIKDNHKSMFPIYLFSEDLKCWCQLSTGFKWIHISRPNRPQESYIGLGSDPISREARIEISIL